MPKKDDTAKAISKIRKQRVKTATIAAPTEAHPRKSVDIKKADNGFVVSSWHEGKERIYIAKTHKEAQEHAARLLKIGG